MKRGGPLQTKTRLERGGPLPKRNAKRLAKLRAQQFGPQSDLCRRLPCLRCFHRPAEPHHVKSRGSGGLDSATVPLCRRCHEEVHQHGPGIVTLQLMDAARLLAEVVALEEEP